MRPPMENDIICQECSDRYSSLLRSARERTVEVNRTIQKDVEYEVSSNRQSGQTLLESGAKALAESALQPHSTRRKHPSLVGYFLMAIGLGAIALSVRYASTILAFGGLGLTFWGVLAFFIQPEKYVQKDLMGATAAASLRSIDSLMIGMGYREKGVYIPTANSDKAVVFVPSEPFSKIPESTATEGKTFLNDPDGLLVVPPGLALASLIEKKLGFKLKNCGIEPLLRRLPEVLIDDLEIVRDVEIDYKGDTVTFKLVDSIYADFCREVRDTSRRCGLGCPMCSALACTLSIATGKPVVFEEDKALSKTATVSSYKLLSEDRL